MPAVLVRSSPAKSAPGEVGQFVAMSESLRVTIFYDETALRHYAAHLDVEWLRAGGRKCRGGTSPPDLQPVLLGQVDRWP